MDSTDETQCEKILQNKKLLKIVKKRWKFEQEHQRHEQQEHQHHDQAEDEFQEDSQEICRFLMSSEEVRICSTIRRNAML